MTRSESENPAGAPPGDGFVSQVARLYAPRPLSPVERARFDEQLEARIRTGHRRRAPWWPAGALAAAAAAAALSWLALVPPPDPAPTPEPVAATQPILYDTPEAMLLGLPADTDWSIADEALPGDYAAIEDWLLADM
jgi:hypothetical protein